VFVADISDVTAPMLAGWVAKGHRIAAIVVPAARPGKHSSFGTWRRRFRRGLALKRYLGSTEVPLIEFGRPHDWPGLGKRLAGLDADVLITFGFHTIIPQTILDLFAKGGLNLHPALLPHYRGPHPIHRLVIDQQHEVHGGVSLHKMTPGFDEGDILGQIAFSSSDWHSAATVTRALANAMAALVAERAPGHCAGVLQGVPQPPGPFMWAELSREPLVVDTGWSRARIASVWRVAGRSVALYVPVNGRLARLAQPLGRLGPATGEAATRRWGTIEFDCADGRVTHLAYNGFTRQLVRWQRILSRLMPPARRG